MYTDDKYDYQPYVPVALTNPREPAKKGHPINPKNL
jgi:hypothetical protein